MAILIVDDEENIGKALTRELSGFAPDYAKSGDEALARLASKQYDAVLSDLRMPGVDGISLLESVRRAYPEVSVVLMSGAGRIADAVQALKLGAIDFIEKPFVDRTALLDVVRYAIDRTAMKRGQKEPSDAPARDAACLFRSEPMQAMWKTLELAAKSDATCLLIGESGTGKELAARAIHKASKRAKGAFVAVNCSALTETLLESELFGYNKGAFTGATTAHQGLFEAADGGTIFLDEIGHITPAMQVRLLRVLQEGEVRRVGATDSKKIDVRVVAATNADLRAEVAANRFRQDLYYRLNVMLLTLPPLRDRTGDVSLLAHAFLQRFAKDLARTLDGFTPRALQVLEGHKWPGNVRELENAVHRASVLAQGTLVDEGDLPPEVRESEPVPVATGPSEPMPQGNFSEMRKALVRNFEQRYLSELLKQCDGNISAAARSAGVERSNFKRMLREHALLPDKP